MYRITYFDEVVEVFDNLYDAIDRALENIWWFFWTEEEQRYESQYFMENWETDADYLVLEKI